MALLSFYPEMQEPKPVAQIEANLGHYGKHYYLRTPMTLKGRGVTLTGQYEANEVTSEGLVGWNKYKVTEAAFERICAEYDVVMENLL